MDKEKSFRAEDFDNLILNIADARLIFSVLYTAQVSKKTNAIIALDHPDFIKLCEGLIAYP
ncbi:hypothetical protein I8751_11735 [Nostocaceae cyanobacterium CENA357]|uniref:Uncharacterized protein n=1 Tax=Atlanticothrix silvestris CENA357 TaxID=1725252 RepID=A0A8J7HIE8_9CYAN|nr:hypothetical protein [Atlanticothrix silvestris]MBH8553023.1 hypothetical protein [Atlanticothrix silvestris CENA357]